MLEEEHIFTIKTKDPRNVADIKSVATGVIISGLNVLKDKIRVGDLAFVVFGGDKPAWKTGLVGIAQISRIPFDEGYDGKKNFRVGIDITAYFNPIARGDLVTYPDTFDTIGIGPITKWEPNQAITSVQKKNAIALLHAICDLRPEVLAAVRSLLGAEFSEVEQDINRYVIAKSKLGGVPVVESIAKDFQDEFITWWCDTKKHAEKTARNYIGYLASLNKPIGEKTNSTWPGVYVYLFGRKSSKEVIQVGTLKQFDEIFGPFCRIFDGSGCPEGVNPDAYAECVQWVKDVSQWACLSSAFKAYREFLEWHEAQQKGKDESLPVLPAVDRLSIALKVFAEKRYDAEWQEKTSKDGYQNVYAMAGMAPAQIAAGSLDDFYKDFLLKIWAFVNGGSRRYGQLDEDGKKAYRQFVVDLKTQLKSFDAYFPPDPKCPDGMGVGVLTELMMRFWPKSCCNYNASLIHEALVTLHMAEGDFVWPKTPSVYQDFMGKCATILRKMEQMKLPRRPDRDNDESPDYITVNEFLWWVREYKDLIQEEVMSRKMKTDAPTKYDEGKRKKLAFDPNSKDAELLLRLLAALRAKPFAILAGHSGTGKSRYVKKLAYMTCNMNELRNENQLPGNYLLLQVKPNWHDSTELLGFRNAMDGDRYQKTKLIEFLFRAYQFKDTPFFLCLDEMNLAPVEQYFAEFLSSMESAEPVPLNDITVKDDNLFDLGCEWKVAYDYLAANGFSIPKNLFIVGTVNMDETTNQFSRKVLDRAFTIEMTDVDFKNYGHVTQPSYADTIEEEKIQALLNGEKFVDKLDAEDVAEGAPLVKVQKALEPTAFAVAYRFANEYTLLKRAIACFDKDSTMKLDALDQAVLMKILPRVAGEKDYIEKVYGKNDNEGLRKALEGKSVSLKKIAEIMKRANDMNAQYITFWP
jgi:hypothetical protein